MASLKRLSKINEQTKYAVFGWVREAERELSLAQIPTMLVSVCLLYYDHGEHFENVGRRLALSKSGRCVEGVEGGVYRPYGDFSSAYGSTQISSESGKIYQWDFEYESASGGYPVIAICSSNGESCYFNAYGYSAHFDLGKGPKKFTFTLNLVDMSIGYGAILWPIYKTIKKMKRGNNIKFRLKVSVSTGGKLRIIDFAEK